LPAQPANGDAPLYEMHRESAVFGGSAAFVVASRQLGLLSGWGCPRLGRLKHPVSLDCSNTRSSLESV